MKPDIHLRWAEVADHHAIVNLLKEMHAEIGAFPLCETKLHDKVKQVLDGGRAILAEKEGELLGSIGLLGSHLWYSETLVITDFWIFASKRAIKRLSVFRSMVAEVTEYSRTTGIPLLLTLYSEKEHNRKTELFGRYGDQIMRAYQLVPVGGEFRVQ